MVIALVAVVLLLRPRSPEPRRPAAGTAADAHMFLDSLKAADARRDRANTLLWAERLGHIRPYDHAVLLARGTAWSDYAVDQRPGRVFPRPALRTSLERIECRRRALGLMDSSARVAREPAQWLDSGERLAEIYEHLGLPGDALLANEAIKRRLPDELGPAMRVYWLRALFYDPVDPDTSAYHERMKRLGLR